MAATGGQNIASSSIMSFRASSKQCRSDSLADPQNFRNYMVNNSIAANGDDSVYTGSLYSKTLRDNNISQEDWKHLLVSYQDKVTGSLDPTYTSSYMDAVFVAGKISSICTKLVVESMFCLFISGQQFNPSK